MQKIAILAVTLSYVAYILIYSESYALSPEKFFLPYSKILFVVCISLALTLIKYKNWKAKIKLLTLVTVLTYIFYNTSLQLQNFVEIKKIIFSEVITFEEMSALGPFMDGEIYYSIGKIVFYDLFAIFTFFAVNITVNEFDETKE